MASHIYSVPAQETLSDYYDVLIDGEKAPLQRMYVSSAPINRRWPGHQREIAQREEAYFVLFAMEGETTLTVDVKRDFQNVVVRPLSKGVQPVREGNTLTFTLKEPGGYTLEVDSQHYALHILADPMAVDTVDKDAPNVLYYGPGVHYEDLITLHSNEILYLDEGAILYGSVCAKDVDNVCIMGRGMIDNSLNKEKILYEVDTLGDGSVAIQNAYRSNTIDIRDCRGLHISGITMRDGLVYYIALLGCNDVHIDGVKIIGSWRYNADGIDLHNCQRVHIENCFVRTYDDSLCVKGNFGNQDPEGWDEKPVYSQDFKDYLAENCVIWCDWGRGLEIGAETRVEEISNITFRNCDVIHSSHYAMDVQNVDYADIHDVTFEDIRVEYNGEELRPYIQTTDGELYPVDPEDDYMPEAMCAIVYQHHEYSNGLSRRGKNHDIIFRDIAIFADRMPPSTFQGFDSQHMTRDILIENLTLNGKPVTTLEEARVQIMDYAENIVIR